jgi:molybdopterin molybdotransferase
MLEFNDAQQRLIAAVPAGERVDSIDWTEAGGRVLAVDLDALLDLPAADNSAMDGYAIRHADYRPGAALPIQQVCYAGDAPQPLIPGQATRLFTGSIMPPGADTVVMQEDARESDGKVEITEAPRPGQHVRKQGEDIRAGAPLLKKGARLQAAQVALLASQGVAQMFAYTTVRVGILTNGDELVAPGLPRAPEQIYNSNGPMLAALAQGLGAEVASVLHARDDEAGLRQTLAAMLDDCDLIISVGGVSVGDKDLANLGGKPMVCLPGNPVSAYAVFALLVSPMIRRMQGRSLILPPVMRAPLRTDRVRQDSREEFLRVQATPLPNGGVELTPYPNQSSGALGSLPWADGLARVPADTPVKDGDLVEYYDFRYWLV